MKERIQQDVEIVHDPFTNHDGLKFRAASRDGIDGTSTLRYDDKRHSIGVEINSSNQAVRKALISHALAKLEELGFEKLGGVVSSEEDDRFDLKLPYQDVDNNQVWKGWRSKDSDLKGSF